MQKVPVHSIVELVCTTMNVTPKNLIHLKRAQRPFYARMIIIYLLKNYSSCTEGCRLAELLSMNQSNTIAAYKSILRMKSKEKNTKLEEKVLYYLDECELFLLHNYN